MTGTGSPVGLTGLAQVNGLRGDTSIEDRAWFDNHYIENWSVGGDLLILARTAGAVIRQLRDEAQERFGAPEKWAGERCATFGR